MSVSTSQYLTVAQVATSEKWFTLADGRVLDSHDEVINAATGIEKENS